MTGDFNKSQLQYTCDRDLPALIESLAGLKYEGSWWDFKREWHASNADLVHDIICMANNPDGKTALLIIGIDEEQDYSLCGITEDAPHRKNTQNVNDLLGKLKWASAWPLVRVVPIEYDRALIDVIVIQPEEDAVPYYLLSDYGNGTSTVRAGAIYSRQGDANVPHNSTAGALATEKLWRRHFGLDKTPLERLKLLLAHPEEWTSSPPSFDRDDVGFAASYHHELFPEFTLVRKPEHELDGIEYFMLVSPYFREPDWWTTTFYYHQTVLYQLQGAYSDHLYIPAPEISTLWERGKELSYDGSEISYGYYIKGSIDDVFARFELDESKEGPSAPGLYGRLMELIPYIRARRKRTILNTGSPMIGLVSWLLARNRNNSFSTLQRS